MVFGFMIVRVLLVLLHLFLPFPDAASQLFSRILNAGSCRFMPSDDGASAPAHGSSSIMKAPAAESGERLRTGKLEEHFEV